MRDKVTALIVTYRRPALLRRAILSVIGQTYKNIQVSIFDDASNDETQKVVESLSKVDDRIKYHCHSKNIGALANFRYAFESVQTPYFSILSDDDCLAFDLYESAINVLDNNPEVMFVVLNTLMIDKNSNLKSHIDSTNKLTIHEGVAGFDDFHSGNIPVTWTAMVFRKELADTYKSMDEKYDIGHDIRFLVNATAKYKYAYLSKVGAFFTQHSESISSNIKKVDLVHQAVQISRYVEIHNNIDVKQDVKDRTIFYIKKLLSKKPALSISLFEILKSFIEDSDQNYKIIQDNINDFKYAGYLKTSRFFTLIHESKFAKLSTRLIFGKLYKRRLKKLQLKMLSLQNGIYRKHFEYIKKD